MFNLYCVEILQRKQRPRERLLTPPVFRPVDCGIDITFQTMLVKGEVYIVEGVKSVVHGTRI